MAISEEEEWSADNPYFTAISPLCEPPLVTSFAQRPSQLLRQGTEVLRVEEIDTEGAQPTVSGAISKPNANRQ
jgi:hypothetical protein